MQETEQYIIRIYRLAPLTPVWGISLLGF